MIICPILVDATYILYISICKRMNLNDGLKEKDSKYTYGGVIDNKH